MVKVKKTKVTNLTNMTPWREIYIKSMITSHQTAKQAGIKHLYKPLALKVKTYRHVWAWPSPCTSFAFEAAAWSVPTQDCCNDDRTSKRLRMMLIIDAKRRELILQAASTCNPAIENLPAPASLACMGQVVKAVALYEKILNRKSCCA